MLAKHPKTHARHEWLLEDYSLEMTAKDVDDLGETASEITQGTQISVTFLPKEDMKARLLAAQGASSMGFRPIPHLSARRFTSEAELHGYLAGIQSLGIDCVLIVAGDLPHPAGPYDDALSIIEKAPLKDYGIRRVAITGYPEGHPDIPQEKLEAALHAKKGALDALGLECEIITQFGFDAEAVEKWLYQLRASGFRDRVRVGVPGPASARTLLRYAARCGVGASAKVASKYGLSITRLLATTGPERLLEDMGQLLDPAVHGPVSLHFYPFGGFETTARWIDAYTKKISS